ncbi:universal stress protein [Natronorarus salvus]|uniref:universal stress protein n=1 Tax=Natronorarus salvus TaxID=3117733 RepID=UPI002F261435
MRILVPLDDSDPARRAVEHATTHYPDAETTLLHVIDPAASVVGGEVTDDFDPVVRSGREEATRLFDAITTAEEFDGRALATETVVGSPAREILAYAEESEMDQIVIGSHGRSGVSRALLGSVAETVVRRAPVPVTVVR